ncbi:hypothetical protein [Arthrobacter sp. TWP1-1]|uniref:hypothetical protein n=1 Tax=Arthrobacter sp. TWP1-1 TaxID=2804568 RepID=UPI003CF0E0E7
MTETTSPPPATGEEFVPESSRTFRMARMLLLLSTARRQGRSIESLDRLAYYEFFADNPWVVVAGGSAADVADRDTLRLAGFSRTQLSYASTGQRFVSRRQRIRGDFAQLSAYGLAELAGRRFAITDRGEKICDELQSSYADGYRASADVVLRRLVRLPNRALEGQVEKWLGHSWLLLDLLDDVRDADVPALPVVDEATKAKTRLTEED